MFLMSSIMLLMSSLMIGRGGRRSMSDRLGQTGDGDGGREEGDDVVRKSVMSRVVKVKKI